MFGQQDGKEAAILDDVRVVALIRSGQTDAFGDVIETYQARIYRYVYRLTGDADLAEDLTQDTFIKAYKSILKTRSELALNAWLYRIATNTVHSMWRRRKLISFIPLVGDDESLTSSPPGYSGAHSGEPDRVIERMSIEESLIAVPRESRTCMVLHYIEGLKYREIADILGKDGLHIARRTVAKYRDQLGINSQRYRKNAF